MGGTAAAVAGIAGTVISAAGAISSGVAQAHAASYQAAIARNNQIEAEQNKAYAIESGVTQEEEAGQRAAAQLGAVKAGIAANNIDVNSGSAEDVEKSQRETGLLSEETVSNNAALQAYGFQTQAVGYGAQAGLLQGEAGTAIPGSLLAAGGTLGTGLSNAIPKFSGFTNNEPALSDAENPELNGASPAGGLT